MALPVFPVFGVDLVPLAIDFLGFYALYLAISLSLNLEFGHAGIPNFGKVMFIAGGASFAASISGRLAQIVLGVLPGRDFVIFNTTIISQIDAELAKDPVFVIELVIISVLVGALVGAAIGFLASYPAIRLREDYLGMLLLGSAQFFQVVLRTYEPLIGGAQNINVPDPYSYWALSPTLSQYRTLVTTVVMLALAGLVFLYAERVGRSPLGRTMKAVRENEDASKALGKDDVKIRRNILVICSAISGIVGVLFTFQIASAEYDLWSRFAWTFWPFLIVIIGGVGNNIGVAVGAFFFTIVYKGLQVIQPHIAPYVFFDVNWLQDLLFSSLLVIILFLRPDGLVREKPTPTLSGGTLKSIAGGVLSSGGPGPPKGRLSGIISRLRPKKKGAQEDQKSEN